MAYKYSDLSHNNGDLFETAKELLPTGDVRRLNALLSNFLIQERRICQTKKEEAAALSEIIETQTAAMESTLARLERKVARFEKRLETSKIGAYLKAIDRLKAMCARLDRDQLAICEELSNLSDEWQREFNTLSRRMAKTYAASQLWREAIAWANKQLK